MDDDDDTDDDTDDDDTDDDHDDDTDDDNDHKNDSYTAAGAAPGASVPCSFSRVPVEGKGPDPGNFVYHRKNYSTSVSSALEGKRISDKSFIFVTA